MKKFLLTLTLISVFGFAQAQIPNPEFEDWSIDTLFEQPTKFTTSNFFADPEDGGPTVTRVANDLGGFSARAESNENQTGLVFAGEVLEDDDFRPGLAYSMSPDTLFIRNRRSMANGDSAFAITIFFVNGEAISFSQYFLADTQNEYGVDTFLVPSLLVDPDSMFIGFTSGNPDASAAGSWIEVDYMRFNTSEEIENGEFEEWNAVTVEDPIEYFTTNRFTLASGASVVKSEDAHSGDFAMMIETKMAGAPEDSSFIGAAITGIPAEDGIAGGFPLDSLPNALTGYYKYAPQNGDSAEITILLKKWNGVQSDFVAFGSKRLPAVSFYAPFSIDIAGGPIPPDVDSAIILIASSMGIFDFQGEGDEVPQLGSILWIDSLSFTTLPNAAPYAANDELSVDPNSSESINVLTNDIDYDGKLNPLTVSMVDTPLKGTVTFEATGEATYQSTTSGDDMFTYTVEDDKGLISNVATVFVTITGSVGINNQFIDVANVYPNPVGNLLNLSIPNSHINGISTLSITDVTGKSFSINAQVNNGTVQVNLKDLSAGIYAYRLVIKDLTYSGKFSKQ
ncbi:MAG: hypothetical protein ACJATA_002067 [Sphingobacteriales bacterium]|jgi:hypothetical protein